MRDEPRTLLSFADVLAALNSERFEIRVEMGYYHEIDAVSLIEYDSYGNEINKEEVHRDF